MKKKQVLSVGLLSCALLLSGCNKTSSHTVTKEQYDNCVTKYGFALNNNVTYSGTFSMGAITMAGTVEIDNNVIHAKTTGDYGFENFFKIDVNTLTEEGMVSYELMSLEPGASEYYHKAGTGLLSGALTESTYMVFIDYEKLSYDSANEIYSLNEEVEVSAPEENMHVLCADLKFDDGQLMAYHFKYYPVSQPMMLLEINLVAEKIGSTVVEFPTIA